ncbi:hypothetical protein [Arenimonas sp.]|uniref:hypothetical protein n=1 Tax=Arenimonas sp. TaxID=1872635 RepID=UPI0039E56BE8
MGPLAALNAIVLGSAVAIAFGLSAVLVIFLVIRGDSEQVGVEIGRLPVYCVLFLALSAVAGAAMFSLMKELRWRWWAQLAMWSCVAGLVLWFALR